MELRRVFLAVAPTDDARQALAAKLGSVALPGRPVPPPNWHVTLRFIGAVDEPTVDLLVHAVADADLGPGFGVRWGSLGAFPRPAKATVLWLGAASGAPTLSALAARIERALVAAGFEAQDRPFRPHLTLSRIRPPQDVGPLVDSVAPMAVDMPVDRVVLLESHLGAGGARYELLESFDLG